MASNKPQTKRIRSSANWLDRETAELIDLVERNPALYNKKAFEYMDKKKYSDLWPKIRAEWLQFTVLGQKAVEGVDSALWA